MCIGLRFREENILKSFFLFNSNSNLCLHKFFINVFIDRPVPDNFRRLCSTRFNIKTHKHQ